MRGRRLRKQKQTVHCNPSCKPFRRKERSRRFNKRKPTLLNAHSLGCKACQVRKQGLVPRFKVVNWVCLVSGRQWLGNRRHLRVWGKLDSFMGLGLRPDKPVLQVLRKLVSFTDSACRAQVWGCKLRRLD